jgi:hypothetical protein
MLGREPSYVEAEAPAPGVTGGGVTAIARGPEGGKWEKVRGRPWA